MVRKKIELGTNEAQKKTKGQLSQGVMIKKQMSKHDIFRNTENNMWRSINLKI